jgi:hypothetical protein
MSRVRRLLLFVILVGACSDFAPPAELDRVQVVGVRAEPPTVQPGQPSRLSILVAGPDGPVPADVTWSAAGGRIEDVDGQPAVVPEADGCWVDARAEVDGQLLVARKWVAVAAEAGSNPALVALRLDDQPVVDGSVVTVDAGAVIPLSFEVAPPASDEALFSWYSTAGLIDRYRIPDTELVVSDEPGRGWVILVYRDGRGGTAWRAVELAIE